ncbi:hypothetical protein AQUSIP_12310 [Aquicella siphonis]|uniref:Uncharacterized protein n=1 Tax=Aquicella siphonis TaxID=254247 RepID=A0A5E4PG02_9COXI|nr:flagellar protein FliT [Aquicella siphonis]VVC75930.1 hypothetical protein AQUSIP_12310 [Aquicella siphonis]
MNTRPDQAVICDFIRHTEHDSSRKANTFFAVLENYLNRPFDKKNVVLARMSSESRARFNMIWENQVEQLKELESLLGLRFPLEKDLLIMALKALDEKLKELVQPMMADLRRELEQENHQLSDSQRLQIPNMLNEIARAYCFHLLTDVIRVRPEMTAAEILQFKSHQEFHRLVRNALFKENVLESFMGYVFEKFRDKNSLNETDLNKYELMLGSVAVHAFLDGVEFNLTKLERLEIPLVIQLLKNVKADRREIEISGLLGALRDRAVALWLEFFTQHHDNQRKLFELLNVQDDENILGEVKRSVLIHLAEISVHESARDQKAQRELVSKILEYAHALDQGLGAHMKVVLQHNLRNTQDPQLCKALGLAVPGAAVKDKKPRFRLLARKKTNVHQTDITPEPGLETAAPELAGACPLPASVTWKRADKTFKPSTTLLLRQFVPAQSETAASSVIEPERQEAREGQEQRLASTTPAVSQSVWKKSASRSLQHSSLSINTNMTLLQSYRSSKPSDSGQVSAADHLPAPDFRP